MADLSSTGSAPSGDERFEQMLRQRLHALADHAPATVRSIDEIAVHHASRRTEPRAQRRRVAGIGATIATLAAGLGLTTLALNGAGDPGESTPEAAVMRFVEALEAEDVLGMIDILDPAEVPAARASVQTGANEAERVGLVSKGLSLDAVAGVDVEVADLSLTTRRVFDDVSVVEAAAGTASITFDPAAFPLGDAITGFYDGSSLFGSAIAELGNSDLPVQIATVERDGRWYVSTSYTIAEYLRVLDDRPEPSDVAALSPVGHATPEEAATAWYQALVGLDLQGAAQLAAPGVGDALLRYGNLWLPDAADDLVRLRDEGWQLSVDGLTYDVEDAGVADVRQIRPLTFTITGTTSPSILGLPMLDPTIPTVVYAFDGGFAVVPAGEPLPTTIDGLDVETDYAVLDSLSFNATTSDENGVIQQLVLPDQAVTDPQPVRVQFADGCLTWTGAAADSLLGTVTSGGRQVEVTDDGSHRTCDATAGLVGLLALPLGSGAGGLPQVAVEEVDGQWYVSPVATLAGLVLDVVRDVPLDGGVFDSDLALYVYGTNRRSMESLLVGLTVDDISESCRQVVVVEGGVVTGVVDDPDLAAVRACWNEGFFSVSSAPVTDVESATDPAVPSPVVATEAP